MLANGSDWSSLLRTTSQGCGPSGRRGCSFMVIFLSGCLRLILRSGPKDRVSKDGQRIVAYGSRRTLRVLLTMRPDLLRTFPDGHPPAGQFHRFLGELHVGDLLDGRLLAGFDVAVLDAVVD